MRPLEMAAIGPDEVTGGFAGALLAGLRERRKSVPCKYLYDATGAVLFERICEQPEYYPTRTELTLLREHAGRLAKLVGDNAELVEFGAGAGRKVRVLLDALPSPRAYVPVDISPEALSDGARGIAKAFPDLEVEPLIADYTRPLRLPEARGRRVGFFPGSTIGNFAPEEALAFLRRLAGLLDGGGLLIGVDLVKDPAELHAAYNDDAGVTAAFNRNLLHRANREAMADFRPDRFAHYAFYNPEQRRVEMHLASLCAQVVQVGRQRIGFEPGETIHTEDSYKYTVQSFQELAERAGFRPCRAWTDADCRFSLHWLEAAH